MNKKLLCLAVVFMSVVFLVCGSSGSTAGETESPVTQIVPTIRSLESNVDKSTTDKLPNTQIPNQNVNLFISGMVTHVVSGNKIEVAVGGDSFEIGYHGVSIPQDDETNFLRAKKLNEFLVMGKEIDLDILQNVNAPEKTPKSAFVFSGGEMINVRMLRSGFAVLGDFQGNSDRLLEFKNAQAQAEDMKLGIWEIDIKDSCGTLPCR